MLFLLFLTPQLIEPFFLGQFLLAAYYFALGFILLIAKLERLLRFCAAAAFCKRSANAAPELFRIFRYLPDVNRFRRAEMQCIVVLQNKFEHFSVFRLAAEGYFCCGKHIFHRDFKHAHPETGRQNTRSDCRMYCT